MNTKKILEMQNITKTFPGVKALDNVSFDLHQGEILALVGENGAGKSTLMRILSGSYAYGTYTGDIKINGKVQKFLTSRDSESAGIEMIYQEISLHPDLSIGENIFLGRLPLNKVGLIDWKKVHEESKKALYLIGLELDSREIVRNLSTSQQQLIAIVRALYRNPRLLILDEPTSALTGKEVERLLELILELKNNGISCIYISHKLNEVFSIADRITVIRDGKSISTRVNKDMDKDRIVEDMVGRKILDMFPKEIIPIGEEVFRIEKMTIPHPLTSDKNLLSDISFKLKKGEILGIGGLVGAGRSELLNAIFGSYKKHSGSVYIHGEKVNILNPQDAIKCGLGLVTEDRRTNGFISSMNIQHNTSLASLSKIFRNGFHNKKLEELSATKLFNELLIKAPSINTNIMNLSGGNQQKVVLSKWLMREADILFLDEPTRGIDVGAKVEIYNLLTKLVKQGKSIILVTSELSELLAMCDRILVLANGKIQDKFGLAEASQERYILAATGIKEI